MTMRGFGVGRLVLMWVVVLGLSGPAAQAEIVSSASQGFSLRIVVEVDASMDRVYEALVNDVGKWWHPDHTYSLDSANLSIDARPGGCFCEMSEEIQVQHLQVAMVRPGRLLRMLGGLGPLQTFGLEGSLTFVLNPQEVFDPETEELMLSQTACELELVYNVGGYLEAGLDQLAPAVDGVLSQQVMRLKTYVETGSPVTTEDVAWSPGNAEDVAGQGAKETDLPPSD